jgi:tetratricopeptide (TPR) repeat protein
MGGLTLAGVTVGRRYLVSLERPSSQSLPSPSVRRQAHDTTRAAIALLERGELDRAGEKLAEARMVAERDPAVVTALARLANARADLVWQRLRLLDTADRELVSHAERQLEAAVAQAQPLVEAANAIAPNDSRVLRTRVDWLRLKGEIPRARELVAPLGADPSDPANAYVLAALDLAEPAPAWPSVIDRLRKAAGADQGLGLSRAALVYSLACAGQLEEARARLGRIETDARLYPWLGELAAFVRRMGQPAAVPSRAERQAAAAESRMTPAERARVEDLGDRLNRARSYTKQGEYDRAEPIYRGVLKQDPANTEALAGLADLARSRNQPNSGELYDQVLAKNPSYLPALMARADLKWSGGDKAGAVTLYRRILEQAGQGSEYGQRAAARLVEAGTKTRSAAPKPALPGVDTSDLPGR